MIFYDKAGTPCCYSDDFEHIYGFDGKPLGYILSGKVWNYNGTYLGQFINNWIIDRNGLYMFFSENAIGGPLKPLRKLAPLKSMKQLRPLKSIRELPPLPPTLKNAWSNLEGNAFFE